MLLYINTNTTILQHKEEKKKKQKKKQRVETVDHLRKCLLLPRFILQQYTSV